MRKTGGHLFFFMQRIKMKPATTIEKQIELLKARGLTFKDESVAARVLSQNNYYRLSGYWRKYQIDPNGKNDNFINDTTFEDIIEIYELDAMLRNVLQKGIAAFEICFRSFFSHYTAHSKPCGQLLYLEQNSYINKTSRNEDVGDLLKKINAELRRSNEKYVAHYRKINEPIPIWIAVEVLSFSTISKMYSRWTDKIVTKKVSLQFKLFKDYNSAIRLIQALVYLRNLCAHQARIWNRELIVKVANKQCLQPFGASEERAQWRVISILMALVDEINQNGDYSKCVLDLCKQNEEFYKGLIAPTL